MLHRIAPDYCCSDLMTVSAVAADAAAAQHHHIQQMASNFTERHDIYQACARFTYIVSFLPTRDNNTSLAIQLQQLLLVLMDRKQAGQATFRRIGCQYKIGTTVFNAN